MLVIAKNNQSLYLWAAAGDRALGFKNLVTGLSRKHGVTPSKEEETEA